MTQMSAGGREGSGCRPRPPADPNPSSGGVALYALDRNGWEEVEVEVDADEETEKQKREEAE